LDPHEREQAHLCQTFSYRREWTMWNDFDASSAL
jgi:hypothetical protein